MCGILGALVASGFNGEEDKYKKALDLIHRRGPDDRGLETVETSFGKLFFGHTRLSILDLSPLGHQPMVSKDQRYQIVFNGEIYNYIEIRQELKELGHTFASDTDTEVLLTAWQQWGESCLPRFDGMFAFAIYDSTTGITYCARDPFGIKPFYYRADKSSFCFSSDVNALRAMVPNETKLNLHRALIYLVRGTYDNSADTFFAGIEQVLPGELMSVRYDQSSESLVYDSKKWFSVDLTERRSVTFEQAKEELREEFLSSVKKQLRSDVPVGAALSGGVDSSSIICAIRHLDKDIPINSFSYIATGSAVSEEKWVDLVVERAKLKSHKVEFSEQQSLADLTEFITAHGEPLAGLSFYAEFSVYRLAKASGMKVMLDGHGADEVIAGYKGYPGQKIQSLLETHNYAEAFSFLKRWSEWPGNSAKSAVIAFLQALNGLVKFTDKGMPLLGSEIADVLKPQFKNMLPGLRSLSGSSSAITPQKGRALVAKLLDELTRASCPPQLKGADRSAMWQSIENRVPFLSPAFVQCALSMPEDYLVSKQGQTKYLFREAMRGIVPDEILDRRDKIGYAAKAGMTLPMTKELSAQLEDGFSRLHFLDRDKSLALMSNADGSIKLDGSSWRLFNLLRWSGIYNVSVN